MGEHAGKVSVTIVTYNSEMHIRRCLDAVLQQDWPSLEIIVVDNDSRDGTRSVLAEYKNELRLTENSENRGFAAAQNQAIRHATGEWVLALNPDVRLERNFLSALLADRELSPDIGTLCGKLLRASPALEPTAEPRVDSCGIYFTPTFRHLDRGSNLPDGPEYNDPVFVFGATAAAALYRKTMIEDVSIDGEFFDEDFFLYREDADVAWRAQLLGWRCLYLPQAIGYHVRTVFPGERSSVPAEINRHCVQNRFLMRVKNATWSLYLRHFVPVSVRDGGVFLYCLLAERSSLAAFPGVIRLWRRTIAKRRAIQQRRKVPNSYLEQWFGFRPVTLPVELPHVPTAKDAVPPRLPAQAAGPSQYRSL
ncbi:MAG: glycosyltransferase family 2 protein [Acidobacteria bacterium]|nr:glycosyltransferase family 2 protein [Acidobacteriota bacterium]